jgi:hypothetical protein
MMVPPPGARAVESPEEMSDEGAPEPILRPQAPTKERPADGSGHVQSVNHPRQRHCHSWPIALSYIPPRMRPHSK